MFCLSSDCHTVTWILQLIYQLTLFGSKIYALHSNVYIGSENVAYILQPIIEIGGFTNSRRFKYETVISTSALTGEILLTVVFVVSSMKNNCCFHTLRLENGWIWELLKQNRSFTSRNSRYSDIRMNNIIFNNGSWNK